MLVLLGSGAHALSLEYRVKPSRASLSEAQEVPLRGN